MANPAMNPPTSTHAPYVGPISTAKARGAAPVASLVPRTLGMVVLVTAAEVEVTLTRFGD